MLIGAAMLVNTCFWGTLILLGAPSKLVTFGRARRRIILAMAWMAERWVAANRWLIVTFLDTDFQVEGVDVPRRNGHYLVISNHVSWVDIVALLYAFHGKSAFFRFFLKSQLLWVPIVGQATWSLDFPFMRRYTPEYLALHPEKRGLDLRTTRRSCERFRDVPVTIGNFVEGTRFTQQKHEDQQSPYRHLLRPRVGGIGFVIASMSRQLNAIYDVTLVYPNRDVTFWEFLTNRVPWIRIHARRLEIPQEFESAAITEPGEPRERFKRWMETIWREKDDVIESVLSERRAAADVPSPRLAGRAQREGRTHDA